MWEGRDRDEIGEEEKTEEQKRQKRGRREKREKASGEGNARLPQ